MKNNKITLLASSVVFMEWLEYALYMYLGVAISHYFFPDKSSGSDLPLILTYAIFAISYIGRPLGGIVFGLYADKKGRRKPLIFSSLLAGIATAAIGVIPSYGQIGMFAPALLLVCRLAQSFAVSGEFNNSSIFLIEHASKNRILAGAWIGTAASAGMFFGGGVAYLVSLSSNPNMWQVAFIAVGVISIALACFRKQLAESPEFVQMKAKNSGHGSKIFSQLAKHKIGVFKIAIIGAFLCVYVYTSNVYFVSYMITKLGYSPSSASLSMTIVQGSVTVLIPLFALLAERLGYMRVLKLSIPTIGVMAFIQFYGASIQSHPMIVTSFVLYTLANAGVSACIFKYMFDNLPVEVRCTGGSLAYSVSAAIFGGTAPILAATLVDNGYVLMPAVYVIAFSALTYLSVNYKSQQMKNNQRRVTE
ncbi:MFS transporter [Vibrio marisflavi]|uniref:Proline/betaine transporter n=1 Tax=Vibrio marisflavi CECT 7928 TaxID=634439 RepID=A0ABM9A2K4_9VIBR|nr:MFS transporter [Vibrio marisflavi]CAH0538545.1 Proline/betaine transporter [Vibrio marisflavi CECT 7928]